ncbi:substrate-binding domain-containing protein [Nocardia camponoti]|uniref:Phosphate-binding protein n=1 Tax=Nocardia camponoti TaxID=1616106 RepID=A0A917QBQ1_9NOCA|nr:substrate-binding domain-containing protein [Nocardia camponoti]GGK42961.1 phosphate-binding protein [Nocardia camponoti]
MGVGEFPWDIAISAVGLVVAVAAFLRQFVFGEHRQLGYRVQMNTPSSTLAALGGAGDPPDGLMLVRIENIRHTAIEDEHYPDNGGPALVFPEHTVVAAAVTERVTREGTSVEALSPALTGIAATNGDGSAIIRLPKERLGRGEHYKVLIALKGPKPDPADPNGTNVVGVSGSLVGGAELQPTNSGSRRDPVLVGLASFLALVVLAQLLFAVLQPDPPPRDCAAGDLTIVGSTAMAPMIKKAAQAYENTCTAAHFTFQFSSTENGLTKLAEAGTNASMVAIGDGSKGVNFPTLKETPVALSSFTLVAHKDVGVHDLSVQQIRDIYRGNVRNWNQVGGVDAPIVLVDRKADSGTRRVMEAQLLEENRKVFRYTSCAGIPAGAQQCEVDDTENVSTYVARMPGSIGYVETSAVAAGLVPITIDGANPTSGDIRARRYPFTAVENAYTNGTVAGDSLAAQFIEYLRRGKGKLIVEQFGDIACVELPQPDVCTP